MKGNYMKHKHHIHSKKSDKVHVGFLKEILNIFANYQPLIVVIIFSALLPIIQIDDFDSYRFMLYFMGYFFIFLSMFKFFNLEGFVDGFGTYDLITMRIRAYGYFYPFIEFCLGAAYLVQFQIFAISILTVVVMAISGIGVIKAILSGRKIKCACLGTLLNVPLSTVSVLENFGMGSMALYMLYHYWNI